MATRLATDFQRVSGRYDHFGYLEDKDAGVFQAPLDLWNGEMSFGCESSTFDVYLHGHRQIVRSAMECEYAGTIYRFRHLDWCSRSPITEAIVAMKFKA
jgi:hypothetical protein